MKFRLRNKQETFVYVVLWAIMFIAPIVSMQFHHADSDRFPWDELFSVWLEVVNLFIVFLLHNFILAPLLVYRRRRVLYFSFVAVLTACFVILQCTHQRTLVHDGHRPDLPARRPEPPMPADEGDMFFYDDGHPPFADGDFPHGPKGKPLDERPPLFFGQHDLISTIFLILMLGMNIGVKLYFKQREDEARLDRLAKENLQQQLEYLRYQINPHFLMNTLNNIHALVDIDSEKAKDTIVELSKLMRFTLYEGSRQTVPLSRDVAFVQSYIQLMRLRYTDKVAVTLDIAPHLPDCEIPPMMFITFVENAFKHGVSYQQESFVSISLTAQEGTLLFTCSNSKPRSTSPSASQEGGVGLQNVQRRLQLIYGERYRLDIDDGEDTYNIRLEIPL